MILISEGEEGLSVQEVLYFALVIHLVMFGISFIIIVTWNLRNRLRTALDDQVVTEWPFFPSWKVQRTVRYKHRQQLLSTKSIVETSFVVEVDYLYRCSHLRAKALKELELRLTLSWIQFHELSSYDTSWIQCHGLSTLYVMYLVWF